MKPSDSRYLLTEEERAYFESRHEDCVALLKTLCGIPAPSNQERRRAEFVRDWLQERGAQGVYIDEADNCLWPIHCEGRDDITVFMAHTDTVFPDTEPMPFREEDGRFFSPGVGDDTANLTMLLLVAEYILKTGRTPQCGILLAADSGEESRGDLRGCRQILKDYAGRIRNVISLDGPCFRYTNRALGGSKYEIELRTEGGHAFSDFGNRNAVHIMSTLVAALYAVKVPQIGNSVSTYNVGTFNGGHSVNSIAEYAKISYELRSDTQACRDQLQAAFDGLIRAYSAMPGVEVTVTKVSDRPSAGDVDWAEQEKLERHFMQFFEAYKGEIPWSTPGSSDINIPQSLGIASLAFGGYMGKKNHTREEWLEAESLRSGLLVIAASILSYFRGEPPQFK